jgi:hypothetical protein
MIAVAPIIVGIKRRIRRTRYVSMGVTRDVRH